MKIYFYQIHIALKDTFKHKICLSVSFTGDLEKQHLLYLVQGMKSNGRRNTKGNLLVALACLSLKLSSCLGAAISNGCCHRADLGD